MVTEQTSLGDDAVQHLQCDVICDCQVGGVSGRAHPTKRTETKGENITGNEE